MQLIVQPEGSSLCGQTCVAMAADCSLELAINVIGHDGCTSAAELAKALRSLGLRTAGKLQRISRARPILPRRAVVLIHRPEAPGRRYKSHWMLLWDGVLLDPGGRWPSGYRNWRINSYLEIKEA